MPGDKTKTIRKKSINKSQKLELNTAGNKGLIQKWCSYVVFSIESGSINEMLINYTANTHCLGNVMVLWKKNNNNMASRRQLVKY